jgi:uncharacterized protein (DUF488 family)
METPEAQLALAEAKALAVGERCCLLCFERDHRECHRRLVAEMIIAETGQRVSHLEVPILGVPGGTTGWLPPGQ